MMQRYVIACGLMGIAAISPALAESPVHLTSDSVKVDAALGWLDGKSQENYYDTDTGQLDDQSDWKITQVPIIKLGISWDMMDWLTLNAQGWTTFSSRSTSMNEYYWWDSGLSGWSEKDSYPNTRLNYANEFDVNVKGWVLSQPHYRLGAMLGYQQTRYSWNSRDGSYTYYDGNEWQSGVYDNEPNSGYKQRFSLPYLGIAGMYCYRNIEFNAVFKFSPWVKSHGSNHYYGSDEAYRTSASGARYYSVGVDIGYYITPEAKLFTAFSWNKYKEKRTGYQEIDFDDSEVDYYPGDTAGLSNKAYNVTFGLQYTF